MIMADDLPLTKRHIFHSYLTGRYTYPLVKSSHYGKSPCFMGKPMINICKCSMFNSKLAVYQRECRLYPLVIKHGLLEHLLYMEVSIGTSLIFVVPLPHASHVGLPEGTCSSRFSLGNLLYVTVISDRIHSQENLSTE